MARYCDPHTGKIYQVNGTTIIQFSGKPYFQSSVLHLCGHITGVTKFKNKTALNSWLKMMGFTL